MPILFFIATHMMLLLFVVPVLIPKTFGIPPLTIKFWRRIFLSTAILLEVLVNIQLLPLYIWHDAPYGSPELILRSSFLLLLSLSLMKFSFSKYYSEKLEIAEMARREVLFRKISPFIVWGAVGSIVFIILAFVVVSLLLIPAYMCYYFLVFIRTLFAPDIISKFAPLRKKTIMQVASMFFLIYFAIISTLVIFPPYWQAQHFNNTVKIERSSPFTSEVSPAMVRLIDKNLATSIMSRYISEFGSNANLGTPHIAKNGNSIVWIAPVYPANVFAQNYIIGFIIIKANDPMSPPVILKEKFYVGDLLYGGHNVHIKNFLEDTTVSRSSAYFAFDKDGKIVLVVLRVRMTPLTYEIPGEVLIYDRNGKVIGRYDITNAPDWVPQVYDQKLVEATVHNIGQYYRGNKVDPFAGGLLTIPASEDRFEITESPQNIINPDTNCVETIIYVHPLGNDRTLAGIFRIFKGGIYFYDFRMLSLISARVAHDYAESLFPKPAVGEYFATAGILYPVKHPLTGEAVWTWFVPIYWRKNATILLRGLVLINAHNMSYFYYGIIRENEHGCEFVARVLEGYKRVLKQAIKYEYIINYANETHISGYFRVLNVSRYVSGGETHIVLWINYENVSFVEATASDLKNKTAWYELLFTRPGDVVLITAEKADGYWVLREFDNLEITPEGRVH